MSIDIYEAQKSSRLIRINHICFDYLRKIYPSWYSYMKGTRMSCHYHLHHQMEIILVTEGRVSFQVSGKEFAMSENDILLINPYEPHSATIPKDCDRTAYYAINIDMNLLSAVPNKATKDIANALNNGNGVYMNLPTDEEIKSELVRYAFEMVEGSMQDISLFQLSAMLRFISVLGEPQATGLEKGRQRSEQFIRSTVAYIQSTPMSEISLEGISEMLCYNKAYFTTLFKKNFGMSFTDYLNNYKITLAKDLIRNGNYNLNDVAEMAGFNYYAYFFKKFKLITGITPSEFLEQCQTLSGNR